MQLEFEIENPPVVDALVVPGRQGPQGPNVVSQETSTSIEGVLVGDGTNVRGALPGEVINASALQSALDEALADIDGGSPDTEYESDGIDGGTP